MNQLTYSRRIGLSFTRTYTTKIGYNCISNRLKNVSNKLDIDLSDVTHENYKQICKRKFILEELKRQ